MKPKILCAILAVSVIAFYVYLAVTGAKHALIHLLVCDVIVMIWMAKLVAAIVVFKLVDKHLIGRIKQ